MVMGITIRFCKKHSQSVPRLVKIIHRELNWIGRFGLLRLVTTLFNLAFVPKSWLTREILHQASLGSQRGRASSRAIPINLPSLRCLIFGPRLDRLWYHKPQKSKPPFGGVFSFYELRRRPEF